MAVKESRIISIENRLDELSQNFIQSQKNQMEITSKIDITGDNVIELNNERAYTATQSASCGDTSVTFEDVPQGIISVNIVDSEGESISPFYKREGNDVIVGFAPLEYAADVTISVQ